MSSKEAKMSETVKPVWHGIARDQINWHPTVIAERCVGCGLCVTSCGKNVYSFDYEANKPVVVSPQMCMVGCTTCATICTQDAIEFPSTGYIRHVIKKYKVVTQAKNMLRIDPDKYDVKKRMPVAG
jgi:NAD-dependent dihydropyrimidine dehydrogenase PreA subunit